MSEKLYAGLEERDPMQLDEAGDHYTKHVMAMTAEGLHSKADIAAELGYRDMRIAELEKINSELEKVVSYSLLRQNDRLKAENAALKEELDALTKANIKIVPSEVAAVMAENAAIKAQREWVSVTQDKPWKHPPDREDVLVLYDNGLMDRAQYTCGAPPFTDDSWYLPCGPEPVQGGRIVAWRHLPPAPEVK